MFGIGPWELVVILLIALIVFGPKRLPEVMKAFGRVMAELRKTAEEIKEEVLEEEDVKEIQQSLQEISEVPTLLQQKLEQEIEEAEKLDTQNAEEKQEKKEKE